MAGSPVSLESPMEIQDLISRAGLALNPGQLADLVLAWRQVAALIAEMPRDRGFQDDMALAFRLPFPTPPEVEAAPVPPRKPATPKTVTPKIGATGRTTKPAKLRT